MIRAEFVNAGEVIARLDRTGARVEKEVEIGVGRLTIQLQKIVKTQKLRGQVLNWRHGRLDNSINQATVLEGGKIVGKVSTNLNYGIGWELGWPGRQSLENAKSKFSLSSADTFKNGTPKKRSFLGSALKDLEASGLIGKEMDDAIARAVA